MARKTRIPMHYKFLLPTILGAGAAFVWTIGTIETDFRRDKQYFAASTNAAILRSAVSEINAAFKLRFFEVQTVLSRLQSQPRLDPYLAMPTHLREEILRVTLYRPR